MNAAGNVSYLYSASPVGFRKYRRVPPIKFSDAGLEKDNRNVYLRIKPTCEKAASFETLNENTLVPVSKDNQKFRKGISQHYKFTKIFGSECKQEEIFKETCSSPIANFLHGVNCLVFAYGATNAGKTFTIQGSTEQPGIIPRALNLIFNSIKDCVSKNIKFKPDKLTNVLWLTPEEVQKEQNIKHTILSFNLEKNKVSSSVSTLSLTSEASHSGTISSDSGVVCPLFCAMKTNLRDDKIELDEDSSSSVYSVWVSYAEIYNESIYDLLQPTSKTQKPLIITGDGTQGVYIKDLTQVCVFSAEEAYKVFMYGQHNLHQASTSINHVSSRSHSIFAVKLVKHLNVDCPKFARLSMCSFVDLAGAERAKKTMNTGERMKESQSINTSLHVLGKCLEVLRHNQKSNVSTNRLLPCRESKLTRLFQRALEGKEELTMIVNINQDEKLFDETLNVLKFSAIAMELQFDAPQDTTVCSLRNSSFSLEMEKLSPSFRSSLGCIEEIPEDSRYMKLVTYIEQLKSDLEEEKKKNTHMEIEIRKEVSSNFQRIISNMEASYRKQAEEERELFKEYDKIALEACFRNLEKSRRQSVESSDSDDESCESDNEDHMERIHFLESKVEALTGCLEAMEELKQAHTELQANYSRLQCELAVAKENLNSALKVNETMPEGESATELAVQELKTQMAKYQKLLMEKSSEIEELKKLLLSAKAEYDEHFREHEDFALERAELNKAIADKDLEIDDLQSQLDINHKKLLEFQQKMEDKELDDAEKVDKLQKICDKTEMERKTLEEELSHLKAQSIACDKAAFEEEIRILQKEVKESVKTKTELTDEIKELKRELKDAKEALVLAEKALNDEQKNAKSLKNLYETEKNTILNEMQLKYQHLEEEHNKLVESYNNLQLVNMELEEAVKMKEDRLEDFKMRRNAQFETYENLLKHEKEIREREQREVRRLQKVMQTFTPNKNEQSADIEKLKDKLKDAYTQIAELQKEKRYKFEDISNTSKELCINPEARVRRRKPKGRKTIKENACPESESDIDPVPIPVPKPEILIKEESDSNRQLRPRRKKVLYKLEQEFPKDDIGILQKRNRRRHKT